MVDNSEHLAILKQSVTTWNKWRSENPELRPDLRWAALSKADLRDVDLHRANLRLAVLIEANLRGADLAGADLRWIVLSGADCSRAVFRAADLRWSHLIGTVLTGSDLSQADLTRANLRTADLRVATIRGAALTGANLSEAGLIEADLSGADLRGANLERADLSRADLSGADLTGADLRHAALNDTKYTSATLWPDNVIFEATGAIRVDDTSSPHFLVTFSREITPRQAEATLTALADYYRACGGVGFEVDFGLDQVPLSEPVHVLR